MLQGEIQEEGAESLAPLEMKPSALCLLPKFVYLTGQLLHTLSDATSLSVTAKRRILP